MEGKLTKKTKTKIYFWLRLDNNFFKNLAIKQLRRISGGDTYIIIYIKMMLLSLETEGFIYFEGVLDNIAEEIAMALDEQIEDVQMTLSYFTKKGLVQIGEDGAEMLQVPALIDQETNWNRYKRNQKKLEQSNESWKNSNHIPTNSNLIPTEIEIDKELKKDKELNIELYQDTNKDERFIDVVEANLGRGLVKFEYDILNDYLINQQVSQELFIEALKIAVANNVRKFNYIARILDNWINEGIKTPEQAYQAQRDFKAKQSKQAQPQSNVPEWSKVNDPTYVEKQFTPEEHERVNKELKERLQNLHKKEEK